MPRAERHRPRRTKLPLGAVGGQHVREGAAPAEPRPGRRAGTAACATIPCKDGVSNQRSTASPVSTSCRWVPPSRPAQRASTRSSVWPASRLAPLCLACARTANSRAVPLPPAGRAITSALFWRAAAGRCFGCRCGGTCTHLPKQKPERERLARIPKRPCPKRVRSRRGLCILQESSKRRRPASPRTRPAGPISDLSNQGRM
jgi:hypothetical protein